MEQFPNVFVMDHPLIQHKLTFLRDQSTGTKFFRELVSEIAMLMCYEATRDLPLVDVETVTPMEKTTTKVIAGRKLAFVPILRAGLGMVDGMLNMVPSAKVGHIGLYRDPKTHKPVEYYNKLPQDIEERDVIVLDPMLATGGCDHHQAQPSQEHQVPVHHRRPRGHQGIVRGPSRRARVLRRRGPLPGQQLLHPARFGRRRRPDLRHPVTTWKREHALLRRCVFRRRRGKGGTFSWGNPLFLRLYFNCRKNVV